MKKLIITILAALCFIIFSDISFAQFGNIIGFGMPMLPYIEKTAAPTVNDDDFGKPFLWFDKTNKKLYMLVDNTSGAADWQKLGSGSIGEANIDITGYWEIQDSIDFGFGNNKNYWWTHNPIETQYELHSSDIDGIGTDGVVLYIDNQTDNVYLSDKLQSGGDYTILAQDPSVIFNGSTAGDSDYWIGIVADEEGDDDDLFRIGTGTTPGSGNYCFGCDKDGYFWVSRVNGGYIRAGAGSRTYPDQSFSVDVYSGLHDSDMSSSVEGIGGSTLVFIYGEYNNGSTQTFVILNANEVDVVENATTNGTTTINKPGENFLTTVSVHDELFVEDCTTTADKGWYKVVAVTDNENLVLNRAPSGSDSNVDFNVFAYENAKLFDTGQSISYLGGILGAGSETVTCAGDVGTASILITTSKIVTDGGADTNEDTISLADGKEGDFKVFYYMTETDAGDSASVTPTNLAGWTKITFDVPGEGCIMQFLDGNWVIVSNNGGTLS